jgi:hypothetical protein
MKGKRTGNHAAAINKANKSANAAAKKAAIKEQFLVFYRQCGTIYWSAERAGVSKDTIEDWRKDDAAFDLAVANAYDWSTDQLKTTAYARAMKGQSKGSDTLMMFLIKQRDPSYRESYGIDARHLHAGSIANPAKVPASVQAAVDALSLDLVKKMAEKL